MKDLSYFFRFTVLALIIASLSTFSACKKPVEPEFRKMTNVKFESLHVDKDVHINMLGNALLFNPNDFGLDVTAMDFDVFVDGKKVTHISQSLSSTIKANEEFSLPLAFDIPLKEVFKDFKPTIAQMLTKRKVLVKVDGNVTVKAGLSVTVPITYEEEYGVPLKLFVNF